MSTVFEWLGVPFVTQNINQLYLHLGECFPGKKARKWRHLVWHTVCQCIWSARNSWIFRMVISKQRRQQRESKVLHGSWQWLLYREGVSPGLFFFRGVWTREVAQQDNSHFFFFFVQEEDGFSDQLHFLALLDIYTIQLVQIIV